MRSNKLIAGYYQLPLVQHLVQFSSDILCDCVVNWNWIVLSHIVAARSIYIIPNKDRMKDEEKNSLLNENIWTEWKYAAIEHLFIIYASIIDIFSRFKWNFYWLIHRNGFFFKKLWAINEFQRIFRYPLHCDDDRMTNTWTE